MSHAGVSVLKKDERSDDVTTWVTKVETIPSWALMQNILKIIYGLNYLLTSSLRKFSLLNSWPKFTSSNVFNELFLRPFNPESLRVDLFIHFWKSASHIECARVQFVVSKIDLFNWFCMFYLMQTTTFIMINETIMSSIQLVSFVLSFLIFTFWFRFQLDKRKTMFVGFLLLLL